MVRYLERRGWGINGKQQLSKGCIGFYCTDRLLRSAYIQQEWYNARTPVFDTKIDLRSINLFKCLFIIASCNRNPNGWRFSFFIAR